MPIDFAEQSLKDLKTKKVSLNLDKDTLRFVNELSTILNTTRTSTIIAIIGWGLKPGIITLEASWKKMKREGKYDNSKIDKLLKSIGELKKKWKVDTWE